MGRFRRDRPQSACQVRSEEKREREIENEVDEAGRSGEPQVSGDAAIRPINAADDLREGPLSCFKSCFRKRNTVQEIAPSVTQLDALIDAQKEELLAL